MTAQGAAPLGAAPCGHSPMQQLKSSIRLVLRYIDSHPFGTLVSGKAAETMKVEAEPLFARWRSDVGAGAPAHSESSLISDMLTGTGLASMYRSKDQLDPSAIQPNPGCAVPRMLQVYGNESGGALLEIPSGLVPELASWLGEWQRGSAEPANGPARRLWGALSNLGCFEQVRPVRALPGNATLIGHASVLVREGNTTLLLDPFLLPRSPDPSSAYQPITHGDLRPDAILITHSHPDHFDPGTLLRFGVDVPIIVPRTPVESLLSIDMEARLVEVGFKHVIPLGWHETHQIGALRVIALPFYGEQPSTGEVLCPAVRNEGNLYLVEGGDHRYAFTADGGRDSRGSTEEVAAHARRTYGPADVLFGGYRSFALYPIQFLGSSVPCNLLFVPSRLWAARQTLMNDPDDLLDAAERWQATTVVPYADGGAPWYWEEGLGPRLDGTGAENAHFDPRPEAVVRAAARRSSHCDLYVPSSARVQVMRPGESLSLESRGRPRIIVNEGHRWPFGSNARDETLDEPLSLTRKRVLLRYLAAADLERRGQEVTRAEVQALSDMLRHQTSLEAPEAMSAWLERTGLSVRQYSEVLAEWCAVHRLDAELAAEIENRVPAQIAFASMRTFARRGG